MTDMPEASPWFTKHFGEHSQQVMLALADAGRAAHERSLEAKVGSQLDTNDAYGSFWVSLPEEVARHLDFLPGREVIRPKGSRYDLVVYEGTLVFPAKCGRGSSGADRIKLGHSEFRRKVFSLDGHSMRGSESQLHFDIDFEDIIETALKDGSFGSATRVALVAFDCSAQGGLQHVYVGEAVLENSGLVTWTYREELHLARLNGEGIDIVGLEDLPGRFDEAPLQESELTLRVAGDSGDRSASDSATGTEGEADVRP